MEEGGRSRVQAGRGERGFEEEGGVMMVEECDHFFELHGLDIKKDGKITAKLKCRKCPKSVKCYGNLSH